MEPNRDWGVIGIDMPPRSIEDVALADGPCRDLPALTEKPVTVAPPTESARGCESDPHVRQTTPMSAAARCDVFFVPMIRVLSFVRPSNVANEPRAAVTGSHKIVRRVGSICVLDGPFERAVAHADVRESHGVRMTRQAARGDTSGGEARHAARGTRQPFAANGPRDPSLGMSPHNGPAKETRRIEPPVLRRGERHRRPRPDSATLPGRARRAQ